LGASDEGDGGVIVMRSSCMIIRAPSTEKLLNLLIVVVESIRIARLTEILSLTHRGFIETLSVGTKALKHNIQRAGIPGKAQV